MHKDLARTRELVAKVIYARLVVPDKTPIEYCKQCSGVKPDCFYYLPLKKIPRGYRE